MSDPRLRALMRLACERLGVSDRYELAVAIGLLPDRALDPRRRREADSRRARTVANWLAGDHAPRFEDAMALLRAAGLLSPDAVEAYWGTSREDADAAARRAAARVAAEEQRVSEAQSRGRRARGGRG